MERNFSRASKPRKPQARKPRVRSQPSGQPSGQPTGQPTAKPSAAEKRLVQLTRPTNVDGFRFRRQVGIGPYIADLFCSAAGLVIELETESLERTAEARERSAFFERVGIAVLHVSTESVIQRPKPTAQLIKEALHASATRLQREMRDESLPPEGLEPEHDPHQCEHCKLGGFVELGDVVADDELSTAREIEARE